MQIKLFPVALTIVENAGRYLLIQESKPELRGVWCFPGGSMIEEETIAATARREVIEEAGVDIGFTGLLYFDEEFLRTPQGWRNRMRFVFLARMTGGELKSVEDEHSVCAAWFTESQLHQIRLRSPFILQMVALHRSRPQVLPMTSFHDVPL